MKHPYVDALPHQRWRSAMARPAPGDIDPMVTSPWRISAQDRVATAGSCFAQHVARRLRQAGLNLLETEPAHSILSEEIAEAFGYGMFSARYGSIYTTRQLLQLMRRAYGRFKPEEDVWIREDGRLFDPFRPTIQPDGFSNIDEYNLARDVHFAAVREMFESVDVFIFTMGLTEAWRSSRDGAVYPLCPGVAAGKFDPERHEFVNFGVVDIVKDLEEFLQELHAINLEARVILTVSPVPLAATAESRHVWTSTTASKAILRVAAEQVSGSGSIVYFPSYEVITNPAARGAYFEEDLRTISEIGIDHVMCLFFKHMVDKNIFKVLGVSPPANDFLVKAARAMDVLCDEARLDGDFSV